jgi:hypothetical protein
VIPHSDRVPELLSPIEQELQGERATALGIAGRRIEAALAVLADTADTTPLDDKLDAAATAVWYYVIVRESLRFYDHEAALHHYAVPPQVMARVGVVKRR